jgi:hypothetical protein
MYMECTDPFDPFFSNKTFKIVNFFFLLARAEQDPDPIDQRVSNT